MNFLDNHNKSVLEWYTYKDGVPLGYLADHEISKPYNEARAKIEAFSWGTFACRKTFPIDAIKNPDGTIFGDYPQTGYLTQYTIYEIRDWGSTSRHRDFPGERIMRSQDGSLLNRSFIVVPNIAKEENPNIFDRFIYDHDKDDQYGPCIDPGALYLYFHSEEGDDINTIAQVYAYDALYNRSGYIKYLSRDVDEDYLCGQELPVFIQFGTPSHLLHLVDDCLYQQFPDVYKGAEGHVPKERFFDVNCVLPNDEVGNMDDQQQD